MKHKKQKNQGFSLLELIVSIAIIAVLTGMLAPQFFQYIERAREARDMQTMQSVYTVVQAAVSDEKAYESLRTEAAQGASAGTNGNWIYCNTLDGVLAQGTFGDTVAEFLGSSEQDVLLSKKAGNGVVCIKISGTDSGLSISVYSGKESAPSERAGTLDFVGASLE